MNCYESEFKEEILEGYKKLLEEKNNELEELDKCCADLKKKVGYEIAKRKLATQMYGSAINPNCEEDLNNALYEYRNFENSERNIERTIHLPREISALEALIEKLKNE